MAPTAPHAVEPVDWGADGEPRSARFGDIYHSSTGALAQARHVFLGGCGLPAAWAGQPQWRILETGFGLGLNFLATWHAWRNDAARPGLLHFVSVEAYPVAAHDLLRAGASIAELAPLAQALAGQWHGLLPGLHRLAFDAGRVLLTLCVGDVRPMLRAQRFDADSIYLDGFRPQCNPEMWSADTLKTVARFARRGTRLATWSVARAVRDALAQQGFQATKAPGLPPKRERLEAVFEPAWTPRRAPAATRPVERAGRCAVVGAGLAGAAVAASLARRGWHVDVLDAAAQPAQGASGAPAGVFAPHVSPDDALLSRLTRAGIRMLWQELEQHLQTGSGWSGDGVLERREAHGEEPAPRLPPPWSAHGPNESWHAGAAALHAVGLPADTPALWHRQAGWACPAQLVAAWLALPGVRFAPGAAVERLSGGAAGWRLHDAAGRVLAQADRVVIAAGPASGRFLPALPLQPVRGQLAWGPHGAADGLPAMALNGDGHLVTQMPRPGGSIWLTGATFERDDTGCDLRDSGTAANQARLARLHPAAAEKLAPRFAAGRVHAWAGVRCASADRRPLAGEPQPAEAPGLWVSTALGSRGLTFCVLCAELLAARWHGEPLPIPDTLARALDARRGAAR
ncbi:FAD-dependent 5-carboxymethylaminomethyl-2-thiouridine(34) oxidoreductase MnmC [Ramlibacter sp. H39-3-26]|uniref:FAD-dependent 5-carboxymethylaminomethyl-2-thiouridine(34) oxidoreductase MnmC n=1 Tax=Curvibacter soli TaxID=3031331 RepID=UPI0023DBEC8D|nr:FAD-dependent 5-carboxymethylaminomethyl-2-thiouridine(34) oxidoreductase MnmC [Ramlibacter sp. H39-3-26]MDF1485154.1 FAD-dependent 5-carboxymethylaminomethyl-2-thiouridine(34) oxidoreductase MnmC [Ramlibacter sp. H39-3-26]